MHRDLKLENILLDANGNIKVRGWWGLATLWGFAWLRAGRDAAWFWGLILAEELLGVPVLLLPCPLQVSLGPEGPGQQGWGWL